MLLNRIPKQTYVQVSFVAAAIFVGMIAVLYARLINGVLNNYFSFFRAHEYIMTIATPALFVLATYIVVRFGPEAKGSGIPQVLEAISHPPPADELKSNPLVSIRTALVKVLSSMVGFLAGASIGREGPTVQISSSVFTWVSRKMKKYQLSVGSQSYLIAGAAAGVAAAFNTPLAGVTFALEEIAVGIFWQFKQPVMWAIIIAGITAQALVGDYLYFGHPTILRPVYFNIPEALIIGLVCGALGGLFARLLAQKLFKIKFKNWWSKALICGCICSLMALASNGESSGSGYEVVRRFMDSDHGQLPLLFWIEKFISTVVSYLSGMAGGIFSPTLSIGAGAGFAVATLFHFLNLKTCSLLGMVAFFSGVVQAPLTAVIIVMEMTDEHRLIIPFMITAVVAQLIGKFFMPTPLYHYLAFGEATEGGHA